jgi:hypothetical protein
MDLVEIKGVHDVVLSYPPNHRLPPDIMSFRETTQWENYRARDMAFEVT